MSRGAAILRGENAETPEAGGTTARRRALLGLLAAAAVVDIAAAQSYPDRPITWIVPYPAGGGADLVSRTVASVAEAGFGRPIVIDNRGGAGGAIGTAQAARARPDGYTVVLAAIAPMSIVPHVSANPGYDPVKDLAPVILLNTNPFLIVVHPSVPVRTVAELVARTKAEPGQVTFASVGNGSLGHLAGELFNASADTRMVHVPYRGGAPALTDLVAGRVQVMFANIHEALPHVREGRLRALAVTSRGRAPQLPDLPTVEESGLPGFDTVVWNGVAAPAGTPPEIIARLNREIGAALRSPLVLARFGDLGMTPAGGTPEAFGELIARESARWGDLARRINLKLD